MIKKVKNTVPWTHVSDFNGERNCWNVLRKKITKKFKKSLELKKQ